MIGDRETRRVMVVILIILIVGMAVTLSINKFFPEESSLPPTTEASSSYVPEASEESHDGEPVSPASIPPMGKSLDESPVEVKETVRSPLEGKNGRVKKRAEGESLYDFYTRRLNDMDAQIAKMRSEETDSTTYSMMNTAENELKLWETLLSAMYLDILDYVGEEQSQMVQKEEREWLKERDKRAKEAARKYSGGTLESLEYTAALADSTRDRCYNLAEKYLKDSEEHLDN